jgi:hypothetical protein
MIKKRLALAAASATLVGAGLLAFPSAAFATPTSPDGVSDGRLCNSSYFQVWNGPFQVHNFSPRGSYYVTGGIQRKWEEETYTLGVFTSGYNFSVFCSG